MTKYEVIEYLESLIKDIPMMRGTDTIGIIPAIAKDHTEEIKIAIDCIQECIDKEESPCYNCSKDSCKACLYSGKLD